MECSVCGSVSLRKSRFRPIDLLFLLVLQAPVRCQHCRRRIYRPIWMTTRLPHSRLSRQ